jgi:hypothetical protein
MKVETQLLALAAISVRYFLASSWPGVRIPWRAESTPLRIREEFAGGDGGEADGGGGDGGAMSWGSGMTVGIQGRSSRGGDEMWIFNGSGSRSVAEHLFDVVGAVVCAKSAMDRREGPLTRLHTDEGR